MGAWGYDPRDCDGALDIFDTWVKKQDKQQALIKIFSKKLPDSQDKWDRLGFLQEVMNKYKILIPPGICIKAISDLDSIAKDMSWLSIWDSSSEVKLAIVRFKKRVNKGPE